ncbi:MAG: hypothetical protein JXA33_27240 [Anaerolineae bacterium]|nr:hypothetical protein [Anaerolineae bacterium]
MSLSILLGLGTDTQKKRRASNKQGKRVSWRNPEPIKLLSRRHNYFPQRFMWRGQNYNIYAVEEAWTEVKRGQKASRHWFRVHCTQGSKTLPGTFDIYQDLSLNSWYIARHSEIARHV